MNICVLGLWHLGSVTAACLASVGHDVIGFDNELSTIKNLTEGKAPLFEPGLDELIQAGIASGKLGFSASPAHALASAEVLWVAFDTPVNDEDQADVAFVLCQIETALPYLPDAAVVLVSSQMPVGSIRKLEEFALHGIPNKKLTFAYSPENLRLGKALEVFLKPDRVVVGLRSDQTRKILEKLLFPITDKVEWMSVESAEMTKHAINAFLAVSVTFANEIAAICELVGADAKEVERGLKTEARIGPKAYLSPGGPFAGGTLARDIAFLSSESLSHNLVTPLLTAVRLSNDQHKHWIRRKLLGQFVTLSRVKVAVWGLTYKPGTDTLRRSLAVELCDWLLMQGASLSVYDPAVKKLPEHWAGKVVHCGKALETVTNAQVLVVGTEWSEFKQASLSLSGNAPAGMIVIDANRHLKEELSRYAFDYVTVGTPSKIGGI
jgi:UDPglucose 6-dehydrogenase